MSILGPVLLSSALALPTSTPQVDAATWIATNCTAPAGAIRVRPDGKYVSGYFGTIVADALVRSRLHDDLALAWMKWYVVNAHESATGLDGVPDDVDVVGDTEYSRGRPDSTDAYGAMFLMLARDAFDSDDPALRAFVLAHRRDLRTIMDSSLATQQSNGMTWSRPQYPMFYTIDNVQVYRGLLDAADLFRRAFHDAHTAAHYEDVAQIVKHGIDTILWDPQTQSYRPYMNEQGTSGPANLTQSYPDALAQVLAVYYGVLDPTSPEAASLVERAAPALLAPDVSSVEHRLVLLNTRELMGTEVDIEPFTPPPLCIDAAWYLLLQQEHAARSEER